jgi:RNA polymerase sigma-70 factor (ECF subfamily)
MKALPAQALPEALSDEEIVREVLGGDISLFELLMKRHNQRLYRAVRSIVHEPRDVEYVMQQAWVDAYTHLSQFAGEAKFLTWLMRIATNEAFARLRRRRLVLVESDCGEPCEQTMRNQETSRPGPEKETLNKELRRILEEEISALPQAYRTVLMFREVEGLSTAETAASLNVTEEVVKTRLHRARSMMRERLSGRAGVTLNSLFTFGTHRCDRIVASVMVRIAGINRHYAVTFSAPASL